jgi:hypothetical protein
MDLLFPNFGIITILKVGGALTTRYTINKKHVVKGSVGNYNETPQPMGQSIHPTWGDPGLPTSKASQYVGGYEWQMTDLISLDIQSYFNWQWDIARMPSEPELDLNPNLKGYIDNGKGRMYGLEVLLRQQQSKRFFGWISYSLARSEKWDYEENRWAIYEKDMTHNLQFIGSWKIPWKMEFGVLARFTTGFPTTPIYGVDYYGVEDLRNKSLVGNKNSDRMTPYFSFNIRLERKFVYDKWIFTSYLEGINVAHILKWIKDKNNQPLYQPVENGDYEWNYDYTEKRVTTDIFRPSIGLKAEF